LFVLGVSVGLVGGFVRMAITGEVNRKLPENLQINYFGAHLGKALRVQAEYKRLYPSGKLLLLFNFLLALSMLLIASSAVVLFGIV